MFKFLFFMICLFFLGKTFKSFARILSKEFYILFLKFLVIGFVSASCFYFFETTLFLETVFAEESSSAEKEANATTKDSSKIKEDPSLIKKVAYFVWDYKWIILVSLTFIIFISYAAYQGDPSVADQMRGVAVDPNLPATSNEIRYFEEFAKETFQEAPDKAAGWPTKFVASNSEIFAPNDIYLHSPIVVAPNTLNSVTNDLAGPIYRVYPCKPILHADNLTLGNSWGWSHDPSSAYWIAEANKIFPTVIMKHFELSDPNLILSYQKVALVEPTTLNYAFYHRVSIHPITDVELSNVYETTFKGSNLKSVYMKDNESAWS